MERAGRDENQPRRFKLGREGAKNQIVELCQNGIDLGLESGGQQRAEGGCCGHLLQVVAKAPRGVLELGEGAKMWDCCQMLPL